MRADAYGEAPSGNRTDKIIEWLKRTNDNNRPPRPAPLSVLGKIIIEYMDEDVGSGDHDRKTKRERLLKVLSENGLHYSSEGVVTAAIGTPTLSLDDYIRRLDLEAVKQEFTRAIGNIETSPRDALSAASNILESICKIYLEEMGLPKPSSLDLPSVWRVVRRDLGIDSGQIEDNDLREITTGICAVVSGLGALRTHASSAHGAGKSVYKLKPRHVRLAVHAAHTIALFILESWSEKRNKHA